MLGLSWEPAFCQEARFPELEWLDTNTDAQDLLLVPAGDGCVDCRQGCAAALEYLDWTTVSRCCSESESFRERACRFSEVVANDEVLTETLDTVELASDSTAEVHFLLDGYMEEEFKVAFNQKSPSSLGLTATPRWHPVLKKQVDVYFVPPKGPSYQMRLVNADRSTKAENKMARCVYDNQAQDTHEWFSSTLADKHLQKDERSVTFGSRADFDKALRQHKPVIPGVNAVGSMGPGSDAWRAQRGSTGPSGCGVLGLVPGLRPQSPTFAGVAAAPPPASTLLSGGALGSAGTARRPSSLFRSSGITLQSPKQERIPSIKQEQSAPPMQHGPGASSRHLLSVLTTPNKRPSMGAVHSPFSDLRRLVGEPSSLHGQLGQSTQQGLQGLNVPGAAAVKRQISPSSVLVKTSPPAVSRRRVGDFGVASGSVDVINVTTDSQSQQAREDDAVSVDSMHPPEFLPDFKNMDRHDKAMSRCPVLAVLEGKLPNVRESLSSLKRAVTCAQGSAKAETVQHHYSLCLDASQLTLEKMCDNEMPVLKGMMQSMIDHFLMLPKVLCASWACRMALEYFKPASHGGTDCTDYDKIFFHLSLHKDEAMSAMQEFNTDTHACMWSTAFDESDRTKGQGICLVTVVTFLEDHIISPLLLADGNPTQARLTVVTALKAILNHVAMWPTGGDSDAFSGDTWITFLGHVKGLLYLYADTPCCPEVGALSAVGSYVDLLKNANCKFKSIILQSSWGQPAYKSMSLTLVGETEAWTTIESSVKEFTSAVEASDDAKAYASLNIMWEHYPDWKMQVRDTALPIVIDGPVVNYFGAKMKDNYVPNTQEVRITEENQEALRCLLSNLKSTSALISDIRINGYLMQLASFSARQNEKMIMDSSWRRCRMASLHTHTLRAVPMPTMRPLLLSISSLTSRSLISGRPCRGRR